MADGIDVQRRGVTLGYNTGTESDPERSSSKCARSRLPVTVERTRVRASVRKVGKGRRKGEIPSSRRKTK